MSVVDGSGWENAKADQREDEEENAEMRVSEGGRMEKGVQLGEEWETLLQVQRGHE